LLLITYNDQPYFERVITAGRPFQLNQPQSFVCSGRGYRAFAQHQQGGGTTVNHPAGKGFDLPGAFIIFKKPLSALEI
jgi:hypothetical protein